MRNKKIVTILFSAVLAALVLPLSAGALGPDPSLREGDLSAKKFSASDRCVLKRGQGEYFAIRVSGVTRGNYAYVNRMQYKLEANPTGGKSQFVLRIPDAKAIPKRFTSDINWWGDKRRDNWWNQKKWTTFWKRSYMKGKVSVRGADWTGKFRADLSGQGDKECSFRLKV